MAVTVRVRRIANPRRHLKRRRKTAVNRRTVKVRNKRRTRRNRKMSPKQIRIFGTKAQKAALKRKMHRTRRANPKRTVKVARRRHAKRRTRRSNPALVLTLGSMANPRKKKRSKRNPMAKTKNRRRRNTARRSSNRRRRVTVNRRRRNPVMRNRRRRRNATRVVVVAPRANRRRRRNTRHHRRNPTLFGTPLFGKAGLEMIGGGVAGVIATKFIPTLLPASITGGIGGSSIGRTVMTGVSAIVAGWAGSKVSPVFGQGVLFGGMMQTLSVALNAFLPGVLTGQFNPSLGDLMSGQFAVPQNPILPAPAPPMAVATGNGSQVRINPSGMGRAGFGNAF